MMFLKKNKEFAVLMFLAVVFFFIYSYLPISQLSWQNEHQASQFSLKFNTPDEVINYYFSQQYAQTGELYYFEPLDDFMNRVVFPRWALVVDGKITPGNFLGIDLIYGSLGKMFSPEDSGFIIPFLTPLFAVIGVLFFYLLIKHFFGQGVAFISALLVFIFPGFWYYASRTMFHNVLFLCLLMIGLYFLIKLIAEQPRKVALLLRKVALPQRDVKNLYVPRGFTLRGSGTIRGTMRKWIFSILTGLFFGLAMITRSSEVVWVFLIVLAILIFYWRDLRNINHPAPSGQPFRKIHWIFLNLKRRGLWPYLLISGIIFTACFIPVLYHNKILYDNYFSTGYPLQTMTENLETGQVGSISWVRALILPFGFHPRVMLTHVFYNYILKLFWPWLVLWLLGLIVLLKHKKTREQKIYTLLLFVICILLFIYYGSWFFRDALDPNLISIGSSYVRYFLPLFIFNIPLIAFLLVRLYQRKKFVYKTCVLLIGFCVLIYSGYQTLSSGPESLIATKDQLIKYQVQSQDLLKYVQKDDIILMDSGTDKILFPARKHLIVPQGGVEWLEIGAILPYKNIYYFHHTQDVGQDYLNQVKFWPEGLRISDGIEIGGGGKLYEISLLK